MNDAAFLLRTAVAASDLNDDIERLLSLLDQPDAETLSGELGVGHTLDQGGQTETTEGNEGQ